MNQAGAERTSWIASDIVRALGLVGMILYHSVAWLWMRDGENRLLEFENHIYIRNLVCLGLFAFWLPASAGTSIALRGREGKAGAMRYLGLGLVFIIIGFLGNEIVWGCEFRARWDILYFLGSCFGIYAVAALFQSNWLLPVLGIVSVGIGVTSLRGLFFIDPTVPWPLFPWLGLFIWGVELARWRKRERVLWISGISLVMMGLSLPSSISWLGNAHPFRTPVFLPPVGIVFAIFGGYAVALAVFTGMEKRVSPDSTLVGFIRRFSQGALWTFLAHLLIGISQAEFFLEIYPPGEAFVAFSLYLLLVGWLAGELGNRLARKRIELVLRPIRKR